MRSLKFAIALTVGLFATSSLAQQTLDRPISDPQDYHLDSGLLENPAIDTRTVFNNVITIKNAAWMRVYFSDVQLQKSSFVRISSLLDEEVQELDADAIVMWNFSSAYFNGDALRVELVAAPGTTNRFVINQVAMETEIAIPAGSCGICGPDDRVASQDNWACRLLPAGCTASVWNTSSCLVSAGHCMGNDMVVQFNVPASLMMSVTPSGTISSRWMCIRCCWNVRASGRVAPRMSCTTVRLRASSMRVFRLR